VIVGFFTFDLSTGNAILSNSIYNNGFLGIDLGNIGGTTPNHPTNPPPGPNNYQNFPVLLPAVAFGSSRVVRGTLNSVPSTTFTVQFFANATPDPSGYGQGQTFLGSASVTTDAAGNAAFQASLPVAVPAGQFLSATATDPGGDTSEFSLHI